MEKKIGEIIAIKVEDKIVRLKVVEDYSDVCGGCYFKDNEKVNCSHCGDIIGPCDYMCRMDRKSVIFKELEGDEMPSMEELLEVVPKVDGDGFNFTIRYNDCYWSIGYTKFVQEKKFWEWNSKHIGQSRRLEDALAQFFKTF